MPECFRSVLERLDQENELLHIRKPVDVRYMSPLIVQADKPVWFHDPISFDIPVVSGLYWKRDRLARSLNWPESELGGRFPRGAWLLGRGGENLCCGEMRVWARLRLCSRLCVRC